MHPENQGRSNTPSDTPHPTEDTAQHTLAVDRPLNTEPPTYWQPSGVYRARLEPDAVAPQHNAVTQRRGSRGVVIAGASLLTVALLAAGGTYVALQKPADDQPATAQPISSAGHAETSQQPSQAPASSTATPTETAPFPPHSVDTCGTDEDTPGDTSTTALGVDTMRFESQKYTSCSLARNINAAVREHVRQDANATSFTVMAYSPRYQGQTPVYCDRERHLSRCTFGTKGAVALVRD